MEHNQYRNAVDHLEFQPIRREDICEREETPRSVARFARIAVLAAVIVCLIATTAAAISWGISLDKLGTSHLEMTDATEMAFGQDETVGGVSVHYLELDNANYTFFHGMLTSSKTGYLRITEDYTLVSVELNTLSASLEKNGRVYTTERDYFETENGIYTSGKFPLQKNAQGEVFIVLSASGSHQWPVYLNLDTGEVRDALPEWTEEDFLGRVIYAHELMGGILVCRDNNMLFWIEAGAEEAVVLDMPRSIRMWYCENDRLYYQDRYGNLYQLKEDLTFDLICSYASDDDLTLGLYTVVTENNELAIVDVYSGEVYVIPEYTVDLSDIDEIRGYNATRYSAEGRIALVQTEWLPEEGRIALRKLGVLDEQTGELKLLEIENDYDGYNVRWLDENRLAVIYDEQYLCIYEFEE